MLQPLSHHSIPFFVITHSCRRNPGHQNGTSLDGPCPLCTALRFLLYFPAPCRGLWVGQRMPDLPISSLSSPKKISAKSCVFLISSPLRGFPLSIFRFCGIELETSALQVQCSTTKLNGPTIKKKECELPFYVKTCQIRYVQLIHE